MSQLIRDTIEGQVDTVFGLVSTKQREYFQAHRQYFRGVRTMDEPPTGITQPTHDFKRRPPRPQPKARRRRDSYEDFWGAVPGALRLNGQVSLETLEHPSQGESWRIVVRINGADGMWQFSRHQSEGTGRWDKLELIEPTES